MKIASTIARYLLGLLFIVFGLNGFLNFIPQPPPPNPLAVQFFGAIFASHFAAFFFAIQVIGGAAAALRLFRATGADVAGGGALQHSCVSSDAWAGHCRGPIWLRALGAGFPAVSRKLRRHPQPEARAGGTSASLMARIRQVISSRFWCVYGIVLVQKIHL